MAENTKLEMDSASLIGNQKISVASDIPNGFHYKSEKNDSFVLDIESFSPSDKDATPNSRITRNLSRKGIQRGSEKKTNSSPIANDRDKNSSSTLFVATSSPRAPFFGSATTEMPSPVRTPDHHGNPQVHHQITISAGNVSTTAAVADNKWNSRRSYSFRRPPSWAIDPRKILLFFATLSSMGTILLIYFTLSVGKFHAYNDSLDLQQ